MISPLASPLSHLVGGMRFRNFTNSISRVLAKVLDDLGCHDASGVRLECSLACQSCGTIPGLRLSISQPPDPLSTWRT
jgi:hypothetical protein